MKVSFLSSGHYPYDDRIYYHLAKSLWENGHKVGITSSKSADKSHTGGISINGFEGDSMRKNEKIKEFRKHLENFNPGIIICSEPLPLLAAKKFARKVHPEVFVIYDITERYPSYQGLSGMGWLTRQITFLKLLVFNFFSSFLADAFIFGEYDKSLPYRFLLPFKRYVNVTYYPDLKYIKYAEPSAIRDKLKLIYPGRISLERGIGRFVRIIHCLAEKLKNMSFEVKIIGWYENPVDERECKELIQSLRKNENVSVSVSGKQPFISFCDQISAADVFLELRADNYVNNHSLPIKLFYYMAAGRPVIISDLKAINREVDVKEFGYRADPENIDLIVSYISEYITNSDLYLKHCRVARMMAEEKYNWNKIRSDFINFIESFPGS